MGKGKDIVVDVSRLEKGMEIKDYRSLCELLGISMNSNRKQQFDSIRRWIDIEKSGYKGYVIKEIYDHPSPAKAKGRKRKYVPITTEAPYNFRKHGNSKYNEYGKKILLKELVFCNGELICDRYELLYILNMCNKRYAENQYKITDIFEYEEYIRYFDYHYSCIMFGILQSILNSLNIVNNLITTEETVVYCLENSIQYVLAEQNEYKIFNELLNEEMKAYGIKNYKELYHYEKSQFYNVRQCINSIKQRLKEELGWDKYARKLKIILNPDITDNEIKMISEYDIQECKKKLNELIIERFREYMIKKGQEYYKYDPNNTGTITIGNEDYGVTRKAYERFCSDLEELINKYIRI